MVVLRPLVTIFFIEIGSTKDGSNRGAGAEFSGETVELFEFLETDASEETVRKKIFLARTNSGKYMPEIEIPMPTKKQTIQNKMSRTILIRKILETTSPPGISTWFLKKSWKR